MINWLTKKDIITIGKEQIRLKPVRLEAAIELILIIAPYIPLLEKTWPEFEAALNSTNGKRPEVLSSLIQVLVGEMQQSPGDITKVFSILVDKPIEWVAQNATGQDIFAALPILDRVNRFDKIFLAAQHIVRFEDG